MAGASMVSGVSPVFFKPGDMRCTEYDVCSSTEKVTGSDTVKGAQRIKNLWRIYFWTSPSRLIALTKGIVIHGQKIELLARNPFLVRDADGNEIPVTKLFIRGVPISFSNEEILKGLKRIGINVRSKMDMERVRGPDGKLTNWVTGGRFVWIDVPKTETPSILDCGLFKANIFYKEMKRELECRRCLGKGHRAKECQSDVRCRKCKETGHIVAECGRVKENNDESSMWGKGRKGNLGQAEDEESDGSKGEPKTVDGQSGDSDTETSGSNLNEEKVPETDDWRMVEKKRKGGMTKNTRKKGKTNESKKNEVESESEESSSQEEEGNVSSKNVENIVPKYTRMEEEKTKEKKGRGRNMLKGERHSNTMDRYIGRSESRKRVKSPEEEGKRQRAKLDEGDRQ